MRFTQKTSGICTYDELLGMRAGYALAIGLLMLLVISTSLNHLFTLGWRYFVAVFTCYLLIAHAILVELPRHRIHPNFGIANSVTLLRALLVCLIAGVIVLDTLRPHVVLLIVCIAGCSLLLDGVDGRLARRYGTASTFGSWFDTEVDALLILVLCVVLVIHYTVTAWVLAIGLMRYLFVGAGRLWPWLHAPLSPSIRGRTIGTFQVIALVTVLLPLLTDAGRAWLLGSALVLLLYSFTSDIRHLRRRAKLTQTVAAGHDGTRLTRNG